MAKDRTVRMAPMASCATEFAAASASWTCAWFFGDSDGWMRYSLERYEYESGVVEVIYEAPTQLFPGPFGMSSQGSFQLAYDPGLDVVYWVATSRNGFPYMPRTRACTW